MATLRAARAVIAFNFVDTGKSFKEELLLGRLEGWAGRKKGAFAPFYEGTRVTGFLEHLLRVWGLSI